MAKELTGRAFSSRKHTQHLLDEMSTSCSINVRDIALSKIKPNPEQVRTNFDEHSLQELTQSIIEKGVLQPIIVQRIEKGEYRIIAGERRWRASKLAKLTSIPCIIREDSDGDEISLIENIQREALSPVEESCGINRFLEKDKKFKQSDLANIIGKDKSYISQAVKIAQFAIKYGEKKLATLKLKNGNPLKREHLLQIAYEPTYDTAVLSLKKIVDQSLSTTVLKKTSSQKTKALSSQTFIRRLRIFQPDIQILDDFKKITVTPEEKITVIEKLKNTKEHLEKTLSKIEETINEIEKN